MLTFDRYLRAGTLQEAYEAAQKKNSVILGGGLWLRLGRRRIGTLIDLSDLGLCGVEDAGEYYRIGAYTTLRELEVNEPLNRSYGNVLRDALHAIVGVQFRNLATIGGSVFGRFGFSDVITVLLALDASVVLYHAGEIPLAEFCTMGRVNDILTHVMIPKRACTVSYHAHRNSATDFPILNVCAARFGEELVLSVGARPGRACARRFSLGEKTAEEIAAELAQTLTFDSNTRASAQYRRHLCDVLVRRAIADAMKKEEA